jgi:excisionase family DNA binding protein
MKEKEQLALWSGVGDARNTRSPAEVRVSRLPEDGHAPATRDPHRSARDVPLVLSVGQAAEALGVSDDLIYELIACGQLPCLPLGRRKLVPRLAVELLVERAMDNFQPDVVLGALSRSSTAQPRTPT